MKSLKASLASVLPDATNLGGESRNVDRERLLGVLAALARDLTRAYWVRAVLILLISAVLVALAWRLFEQSVVLLAISAAIAIVLAGGSTALRQVTDELARTRMLLDLAPDLSREALTEMVRWMALSR